MTLPVAYEPGQIDDLAIWTIDRLTAEILDWNIQAGRLCGWEKGDVARSFDDLAQLLVERKSESAKPDILARTIGLKGVPQTGRRLTARLRSAAAGHQLVLLEALDTGSVRQGNPVLLVGRVLRSDPFMEHGINAVAGVVGHELNNIGVPLDGFGEIAMQNLSPTSPARQFVEEMLIGIARVRALAYQLECLAESESNPRRVTIGECIPDSDDPHLPGSWTINWACNADTAAVIDPLQARRAIESLLNTVWNVSSRSTSRRVLTVSQTLPRAAECATCGAVLTYTRKDIRLQPDNSRPVTEDFLRDSLGLGGMRRAGQRLSMTILVHCAHQANGHLLLDRRSGALSLAFPSA